MYGLRVLMGVGEGRGMVGVWSGECCGYPNEGNAEREGGGERSMVAARGNGSPCMRRAARCCKRNKESRGASRRLLLLLLLVVLVRAWCEEEFGFFFGFPRRNWLLGGRESKKACEEGTVVVVQSQLLCFVAFCRSNAAIGCELLHWPLMLGRVNLSLSVVDAKGKIMTKKIDGDVVKD